MEPETLNRAAYEWGCDTCGADGVLELGASETLDALVARARQAHADASPKCPAGETIGIVPIE